MWWLLLMLGLPQPGCFRGNEYACVAGDDLDETIGMSSLSLDGEEGEGDLTRCWI